VTSLRAQDRIGETVTILIEEIEDGHYLGRAGQQGPEDGRTSLHIADSSPSVGVGDIVTALIVDTTGVDWHANLLPGLRCDTIPV
jgi:hypothetical protein